MLAPLKTFTLDIYFSISATHLKNQQYNICIRRGSGFCSICYSVDITAADPNSFGLSLSPDASAAQSATGTSCSTDFITIPNSVKNDVASTLTTAGVTRFCGRFFATADAATASVTACCKYPELQSETLKEA